VRNGPASSAAEAAADGFIQDWRRNARFIGASRRSASSSKKNGDEVWRFALFGMEANISARGGLLLANSIAASNGATASKRGIRSISKYDLDQAERKASRTVIASRRRRAGKPQSADLPVGCGGRPSRRTCRWRCGGRPSRRTCRWRRRGSPVGGPCRWRRGGRPGRRLAGGEGFLLDAVSLYCQSSFQD